GLMMRESLSANARTLAMVQGSTGGRIAELGTRSSAGASMTWVTGDKFTWVPVWFRLQRTGNTFTASQSSDGVTWFTVGTSTVSMASTYLVGLASCSGNTGQLDTTMFDNVGPITANLVPNGTYVITSVNSGLVIDDPGSSKTNGTIMQQWTANNGA